jgi:ActR/RegA family two-component response regulator
VRRRIKFESNNWWIIDMRVITENGKNHLQEKLDGILESSKPSAWRCIICALEKDLYYDQQTRDIVKNFLAEDLSKIDGTAYWFRTGDLVVLFQGFVGPVEAAFRKYLDRISENTKGTIPEFNIYEMGRQSGWVLDEWQRIQEDLLVPADELPQVRAPQSKTKVIEPDHVIEAREKAKAEAAAAQKKAESDAKLTMTGETVKKPVVSNASPEMLQKQKTKRGARTRLSVLVISSDMMAQKEAKTVLADHADCACYHDIEDAVAYYQDTWPDIALIDAGYGEAETEALLSRLRENDPDAYVVVVGGVFQQKEMARFVFKGAKGVVAKPLQTNADRIMRYISDRKGE